MFRKNLKNIHLCEVLDSKGVNYEPILPPNANLCQRLLMRIKCWNTLNMSHPRCKEFYRNRYQMYVEQERHVNGNILIIHPFSPVNAARELFEFVVMCLFVLYLPFKVTFSRDFFSYELLTLRILILVNMVFVFITGYCNEHNKEVEMRPSKIAKRYIFSYFFVDIIIALPVILIQYIDYNCSIYIIHFLVFFRVSSCQSIMKKFLQMWHVSDVVASAITFLFKTFCIIHYLACCVFLVPRCIDEASNKTATYWAHGETNDIWINYVTCLTCTTAHFFGVSVHPYHFDEPVASQLILTFILLFGRLYTLYIFSSMLVFFSTIQKSSSEYEEFRHRIVQYSITNKLPHYLKNKILYFFRYKFQKRYFDEQKIISVLSNQLQHELKVHNLHNLVTSLNWLSFLTIHAAEDILLQTEQEYFLPNEVILQPRKKVRFVYFIKSGTAVILDRKGNELMHYDDGHAIGMISLLWDPDMVNIFSVVVIEVLDTYKLTVQQMILVFKKYPALLKYYEDTCKSFTSLWDNFLAEDLQKSELSKILQSGQLLMSPRFRNQYYTK